MISWDDRKTGSRTYQQCNKSQELYHNINSRRIMLTSTDVSGRGVSAALYYIANQACGVNQGQLTSKSRLTKKNTTMPRFELISCHIAWILLSDAKIPLKRVKSRNYYAWPEKTVALHWISTGKDLHSNQPRLVCNDHAYWKGIIRKVNISFFLNPIDSIMTKNISITPTEDIQKNTWSWKSADTAKNLQY